MPHQNYTFLLKNLKKIAEMAGCTQPISHHMGRHYYASILTLSYDVPIDVKCLKEYLMETKQSCFMKRNTHKM
jgi:site-specific recombinase XerD